MTDTAEFTISRFNFNDQLPTNLAEFDYAKGLWPVVYILNDGTVSEAYVGETTDAISRIGTHLKNTEKKKLTSAYLICSEKFNKSATLDLEANLIKYISGDGKYTLLNANLGLAHHNYYQKAEVYDRMFDSVWNRLRTLGIAKHSLAYIDNSDLFKYSPYKTLSREQKQGITMIITSLLRDDFQNMIIEGGAGTGKTIMAIYLFKLLHTPIEEFNLSEFEGEDPLFVDLVKKLKKKYPDPKMALVIPMSSFRKTVKKVFKHIKGLNANMVIGPSELIKDQYDVVLVDESHRLRRRVNLGTYFGTFDKVSKQLGLDEMTCSELDWIIALGQKSVFFYDEDQSIKPSDVRKDDFHALKMHPLTKIERLESQFRVKAGKGYVNFVKDLLKVRLQSDEKPTFKNYEFLLFDDIRDMNRQIKEKEREWGLARVVAGYSWPWLSKKNKTAFDIRIDGIELRWNSVSEDWVNSANAADEVGCIHTTQGYDINYTAIIFGEEIGYDPDKEEIVIRRENYHDRNGKQTITDPAELKAFILNIYQTLMLRGIRGTYVYACDENLRDYFSKHIRTYSAPAKTNESTSEEENEVQLVPYVNSVPLYDLAAAAGDFSPPQLAEEFDWVPVPSHIRVSEDLFACKVVGESMNKIIPDGSICLFRKYAGGSRNGKIVLVKLTHVQDPDFGSNYTVKEYRSTKTHSETGEWHHETITLLPLSNDSSYQPIRLEANELNSLEVVGLFEGVCDPNL